MDAEGLNWPAQVQLWARRRCVSNFRRSSALVVVERDTLLTDLLTEDLVLGAEILDGSLLLPVQYACQNDREQAER